MSIEPDGQMTMDKLRFAAEDGHAESLFLLGIMHARGQGVPVDETEAGRLFHQAAKKGHARAKTSLGFMLASGRGTRRDVVGAYVLFMEAAAAGDPVAQDLSRRLRLQMTPEEIQKAEKRIRV